MQERFPGPPERYAATPGGFHPDGRDGALPTDPAGHRASLPDEPAAPRVGLGGDPEPDLVPRNGSVPGRQAGGPADRAPTLPSLDLDGLSEPVFPPAAWLEGPAGSLADHPLLRGLLLELPPKGAVPPPGWLDRWFEAARSILELLYLQDGGRTR